MAVRRGIIHNPANLDRLVVHQDGPADGVLRSADGPGQRCAEDRHERFFQRILLEARLPGKGEHLEEIRIGEEGRIHAEGRSGRLGPKLDVPVDPDADGALDFRELGRQRRRQGRHGPGEFHPAAFLAPLESDPVDPVPIHLKILVPRFVDNIDHHQKTNAYSDGQPEDIDEGDDLMPADVPEGNLKITLHDRPPSSCFQ